MTFMREQLILYDILISWEDNIDQFTAMVGMVSVFNHPICNATSC